MSRVPLDIVVRTAQGEVDGPIGTASRWIKAVLREHDLAAGWPLMDRSLRRKSVQPFIEANLSHPALAGENPDELLEALIEDDPTQHHLWGGFAVWQVTGYREAWDHINIDHCGFGSRPRPLAPDLELLAFMDKGTPAPVFFAKPMALPAVGFVMRYLESGGWVIQDFTLGATAEEVKELEGDS